MESQYCQVHQHGIVPECLCGHQHDPVWNSVVHGGSPVRPEDLQHSGLGLLSPSHHLLLYGVPGGR